MADDAAPKRAQPLGLLGTTRAQARSAHRSGGARCHVWGFGAACGHAAHVARAPPSALALGEHQTTIVRSAFTAVSGVNDCRRAPHFRGRQQAPQRQQQQQQPCVMSARVRLPATVARGIASANVGKVRVSNTVAPNRAGRRQRSRAAASTAAAPLSLGENLACGAIGRTAQIVSTFPIDTIKIRVQVSPSSLSSSSAAVSPFSRIASAVNKGHLYRGASVSLMGQIPYGMLTFGIYESLKAFFARSEFDDTPAWTKTVLAATLGDAVGSLWLTPSEVVKSKTQTGLFASPMQAIAQLSKQGPLAFYQGYSAAIARDIPFRIIQLLMFERSREWYMRRRNKSFEQISALENLVIGAFAGTVTGATTCPLDVVRTRMMSQPKGTYKNAMDCVAQLVAKDGARALMRGIIPRCFVIGPSSAIFFFTFEAAKAFFRSRARSRAVRRAHNGGHGTCGRRAATVRSG